MARHDGTVTFPGDAFLLTLTGVLLMWCTANGVADALLRPYYRAALLISGIVIVGLGIVRWVGQAPQHLDAQRWWIVVPAILVAFWAIPPLSPSSLSYQARPPQTTGQSPKLLALPSDKDATVTMPLDELYQRFLAAESPSDRAALEGHKVQVIGMLHERDDHSLRLSRFKIFCCAADAMIYNADLTLPADDAPALPNDAWAQVTGRVSLEQAAQFPIIQVESLQPIDAPRQAYL